MRKMIFDNWTVKHIPRKFFLKKLFLRSFSNGEGGIWTLAPLLTTYSLSRGAPSATWVLLQMPDQKISFFFCNGEGGIRTHAPFRTNGFQDRLVMTTSIPLHISVVVCAFVSLEDKWYSIICFSICQYTFAIFFTFLLQISKKPGFTVFFAEMPLPLPSHLA